METSKQTIRSRMRRQRAAVPSADANTAAALIARRVALLDEFQRADVLVAYAATGGEVPATGLIALALARQLPVLLPRMNAQRMELAPYGPGDRLRVGAYGIAEPWRPAVAALGERPLIVLPLLAFDRHGTRLGRGGGHYDRAATSWPPTATRVGLAYSFQECELLPRDTWDAPLDLVVTEARVLRCSDAAAAGERAAEAPR